MKTKFATFTVLATSLVALSACSGTAHKSVTTYTCAELVTVDEEYAGSVIYYTKGHYDAQKDIWTDYGPSGTSATVDQVDDYYLPVEDIYEYCVENPDKPLKEAINGHSKQ